MKIEKNKWKKNLFSVLNDNFINFRIFDALYFTMFMNRTFILKKKRKDIVFFRNGQTCRIHLWRYGGMSKEMCRSFGRFIASKVI